MSKGKKKKTKAPEKKSELGKLQEKLARALADYDNLRKRIEREQESYVQFASLSLITKLLPVVDMLEQVQEHLNDPGLAIAIKELTEVLKEEKVERIRVKKMDKFNEELFEAVEVEKGDKKKKGKVAEVVLSGWKYKDGPIIRPAKVKVYK